MKNWFWLIQPRATIGIATLSLCAVCGLTPMLNGAAVPAFEPATDAQSANTQPLHWTVKQWEAWRDGQIKYILEPTFVSGAERMVTRKDVIERSLQAYNFIQPCLQQEPDYFTADPDRARAMTNFLRFITAQHWMGLKDVNGNATQQLGLTIPDKDYWDYARDYVEFPPLLKSPEFLKSMMSPSTYKAAVDMIEAHNKELPPNRKWIVMPFMAQFIKSVDKTTYGRLLVLVPDEPAPDGTLLDKWFLFAIATPDLTPLPYVGSVSIISIRKDPAKPGHTRAYFMDFLRLSNKATGQIDIVPTVHVSPVPSKNCYDCHKAAVIPIKPETEYEFDTNGNLVSKTANVGKIPKLVNDRIFGYGLPEMGVLDTAAYGPSLGQPGKVRTDQFIAEAAQGSGITAASYAKIKQAMNCAACHDQFARINYLQGLRTDRDIQAFPKHNRGLVQTYIEKGWMPPGNTLSPQERKALWQCVSKEYYDSANQSGAFVDWLRGL